MTTETTQGDIRTLAGTARLDVEIKRSRFLTQATRADTAEQALEWLQQVSDPSATHNCWAFRIGQNYRFNDDGEPGGSAGRPMLSAIEGQGLDHVVAVVTRWYGGTKLGVGGLARAYGGSTAQCLQQAPQEVLVAQTTCQLHCDFALEQPLRLQIHLLAGSVESTHYDGSGITIRLQLPATRVAEFREQLRDISRGQATLQIVEAAGETV